MASPRTALASFIGPLQRAYHWHPEGHNPGTAPHLHFGSGVRAAHTGLATAHLPTGYVPAQDVIWLLIDELGVAPRRPDWREVLTTTRRLAPKGA